jgi:hypothetical protein
MSRDNRILLFLISLISWPGITSSGAPGPQTPKKADKQIDLRISLKTNVIKVGSPLDVHVEIWNVGREGGWPGHRELEFVDMARHREYH